MHGPPDSRTRERELLIAAALLVAADVMLWAALLGTAMVVRSADAGVFDAHGRDMSQSLYTWLPVLPNLGVLLVGGLLLTRIPWRRTLVAALCLLALLAAVALGFSLETQRRSVTQLVRLETQSGSQRYALEKKPWALAEGFVAAVPDDWTLDLPYPEESWVSSDEHERVMTQGQVIAETGNVPARQAFFAIYWVCSGTLIAQWLATALIAFIALFQPALRAAVALWGFWSALVATALGLLIAT